MRITGLATGLDTDNMIKQMMKPYVMRVDKMKQDRQIVQWRQELYRDIIGNTNSFKKNYFDPLKSDKYMLSSNSISAFNVDGITNNSVKVNAGSAAKTGNYEVTVENLAETAKLEGIKNINTVVANVPNFGIRIDDSNNQFTVGGKTFTLDVDSVKGYNKYSSLSELANAMNSKMATTDINAKAVVKNDSIQFMELIEIKDSNKNITFNYAGTDYEVTLAEGKYTADEITAAINSRLSGLKSKDGKTDFPSGKTIVAETSAVGTKFTIDKAGISIKDGESSPINPVAKSISTAANSTGTDADFTDGISLKYKNEIIAGFNDTLNIRIGGMVKTIKLDEGIKDIDALVKNINEKLTDIGIDKLTASKSTDGKIVFNSTSVDQLSIYGNASSVFGAYDNFEINMKGSTKVADIIDPSKTSVSFTINDKDFSYDFAGTNKDKTIDQLISEINSKAGVNMSYSTASKKFTIESNDSGASAALTLEDKSGGFLNTLFGVAAGKETKTGQDAKVTIKGPDGTSSTYLKPQNTFEVDGVTYTLNTAGTGTTKFSLTQNIDESFNKIKSFIDDYNKLIDDINKKISEKRQYKYLPLTEEQKKDMKENDIKLWEDKAKEGLIRNDPDLSNMLNSLRRSFFDKVEGTGLSLREIGLDTSSDYLDNGKIVIDENKLKEALKTKGDKVAELFNKKSTSYPRYDGMMPTANRNTRYNEEGIFQRINDILEDYTRTTSGKGVLLNKAGIKGDFTNSNNILSEDLKRRDTKISEMEAKLADRENKYYLKFAQLEKAMQQMNSQSAWFAQQFGGGQK